MKHYKIYYQIIVKINKYNNYSLLDHIFINLGVYQNCTITKPPQWKVLCWSIKTFIDPFVLPKGISQDMSPQPPYNLYKKKINNSPMVWWRWQNLRDLTGLLLRDPNTIRPIRRVTFLLWRAGQLRTAIITPPNTETIN